MLNKYHHIVLQQCHVTEVSPQCHATQIPQCHVAKQNTTMSCYKKIPHCHVTEMLSTMAISQHNEYITIPMSCYSTVVTINNINAEFSRYHNTAL